MKITFFKDHINELAIGAGIGFGIWAVILGIEATPKATKLIEDKKEELGVTELTTKDKIKTAGKCYIPTITALTASTTLIVAGTVSSGNKTAAVATACSIAEAATTRAENALRDYKQATLETIGEEKEKEVRKKAADIREERETRQPTMVMIQGENILFEDPFGVNFYATMNTVENACIKVNNEILNQSCDGFSPWSTFRSAVGLDTFGYYSSGIYEDIGFASSFDFDPLYDTHADKTADGRPCLKLDFDLKPRPSRR